MVDELPLKILWDRWLTAVGSCSLVDRISRPSLLPHLRAVVADQVSDAPETLGLARIDATTEQVLSALAAAGPRAVAAGWPAALPGCSHVVDGPVSGYAEALLESRLAILGLLQGASPDSLLPTNLNRWRDLMVGEDETSTGDTLPSSVWSAAEKQSSWVARGILLHLALHRARPWSTGVGRTARLLMNTLVAAAGHRWLTVPTARQQEYEFAVAVALGTGDAGPFCRLMTACADA